jgi:hypothetical protein
LHVCCSKVDEVEIVVQEAHDPDAIVQLLMSTRQHGDDAYPIATHADGAAVGDDDVAMVQRVESVQIDPARPRALAEGSRMSEKPGVPGSARALIA